MQPLLLGTYFGLILGLIDVLYRVFNRSFEWFEIYQALMLPIVFYGTLFFLICSCFKRSQLRQYVPSTLLLALSFFVAAELIVKEFLFREQEIYSEARIESGLLIGIVAVFIFVFTLRCCPEFIIRIQNSRLVKLSSKLFSNLLFMTSVFIIVSLFYDIFELRRGAKLNVSTRHDKQDKPNLILITLDTVRADHLSLYGYRRKTSPNLDEFAKNAAVFSNALSTTSWTLPAHASIFTGEYISEHKADVAHQTLDDKALTLAEILSQNGFITAGFVAGPYCKAKYGIAQGFQYYSDRLDFFEWRHTLDSFSTRRLINFFSEPLHDLLFQADGEKGGDELNAEIFPWLESASASNFFLFINYFDAHDPYLKGVEFRDEFTSESRDPIEIKRLLTDLYQEKIRYDFKEVSAADLEYMQALYDAEIKEVDKQLKNLLDRLKDLKLLENTIIVIASDHGEEFMEHGGVLHAQTLYQEVLHVPLIIYYPAKVTPQRVEGLVSNMDIMPTVLNLMGIDLPVGIDGINILPNKGEVNVALRTEFLAERGSRAGIRESALQALIKSTGTKLILANPQEPRLPNALFNLLTDAEEKQNLYSTQVELREMMKTDLLRLVK